MVNVDTRHGSNNIREKRLPLLLEVGLVGVEHAVHPWEQLLSAVVGVEDDGAADVRTLSRSMQKPHSHAVGRSNSPDEVGSSNRTGNGSLLVSVGESLTTEEGGTTLGDLEDDGGLDVTGGLEDGVDNGRRGNVLRKLVRA
jgi:hypothetical protein